MFESFREEYKLLLEEKDKKSKVKVLETLINKKEKELDKENAKIANPKGILGLRSESSLQLARIKSNHIIRELTELYVEYDQEYFKNVILNNIHSDMCVLDVLHLYYSYDFYKKTAIQKAYELDNYKSIIEYSDDYDIYSMNPNNLIAEGIEIFNESNVSEVIANKYKLSGINVEPADVSEENIKTLLNKVLIILRINVIENSDLSLDEIWFMVQVAKILEKEIKE